MLIGSLFTGACAAKSMKVSLDVVLFSYLDRPIFDVFIGNEDIGMAGPYPHSGTGTVTGVPLMLGAQEVRWRLDGPPGMAGNGDTVRAANTVRLDSVPADARYLAVHIFPDNTVELACSRFFPELTARGEAFDQKWQRTHGG